MAAGWMKSLQCKSRAYDDVHHPLPKQPLLTAASCRSSYQNLKDVVVPDKPKPKPKSRPIPKSDPFSSRVKRSHSVKPKHEEQSPDRVRRTLSTPIAKLSDPFYPSVEELDDGHPSRKVVEIIFGTRWGPDGFPGRVEMVFKVLTPTRASTRFEAYRDLVRFKAGPGSGRCVADGNEMMRFHCLGPSAGLVDGCEEDTCTAGICTYSGSGAAHDSAGGGKGRRAMVVCRVIAGRVSNKRVERLGSGKDCDFDSVSGENGELLVFDSRAVLPCFLVVYKL